MSLICESEEKKPPLAVLHDCQRAGVREDSDCWTQSSMPLSERPHEAADQNWQFVRERHLMRRFAAIERSVVCPSVTLQSVRDFEMKYIVFGVPEQDADSAGDQERGLDDLPRRMPSLNGRIRPRFDHAAEDRGLGHETGSPNFLDKLVPTRHARLGKFQLMT